MKNSKKALNLLVLVTMMFGLIGCSRIKSEPKVEINHKIVGKWSSKNFDGTPVITNFMKDGTATASINGKEVSNQKYRFIDETTLETETKQGVKWEAKVEFSDNDNTMTVTDFTKHKTPYKRQ